MRILITGDEVYENGSKFSVTYEGDVVFVSDFQPTALCVALDRLKLSELRAIARQSQLQTETAKND